MVGVGHDVASAVTAARDAQSAGAALIMVHQPVHPYVSDRRLDRVPPGHRERGAGAGRRPLRARRDDPGLRICAARRALPERGRGEVRRGRTRCTSPPWRPMPGRDASAGWPVPAELHAPGYFALGATGFTSGMANVDPETSLRFWRALDAGEQLLVTDLWQRVRPFEELRAANASADNVSVVKEALCQLEICGREVRPPSSLLPPGTRAKITGILKLWGLLP